MKKIKNLIMALLIVLVTTLLAPNVNAETMSNEFKSYLNEEGNFVVNSVKPTNIEEFWIIFETLYCDSEGECLISAVLENPDAPIPDYTSASIIYRPGTDKEESHKVSIEYKFDNDIKTDVDKYIKKIPEDKELFDVSDMEVINYIYNGKGNVSNLINYSGELKRYIDYKNFSVDIRMGMDNLFYNEAAGLAIFTHNKIIYSVLSEPIGASSKHIIYVPDSTGNTHEELMQAAQKRIDDYIGKNKVTLSYLGTGISNLYKTEKAEAQGKLDENDRLLTTLTPGSPEWMAAQHKSSIYREEVLQYQTCIDSLDNNVENKACTFLKEAEGDFYFNAKVFAGTENEANYYFIIVKDSSKMINPVVKTTDAKTDITITTQDTSIPLDTLIKAEKLTSGTEYEKIVEALDVKKHETYDLSLSSSSVGQNIDTGEFEIKIPISDAFKDKTLIAYYVGEDGKVEEHEVTVKDGYAIFSTDHFSIYTLAEKPESTSDSTTPTTPAEPTTDNPQTSDNVLVYVGILFLSVLGVISLTCININNKKKIKNN